MWIQICARQYATKSFFSFFRIIILRRNKCVEFQGIKRHCNQQWTHTRVCIFLVHASRIQFLCVHICSCVKRGNTVCLNRLTGVEWNSSINTRQRHYAIYHQQTLFLQCSPAVILWLLLTAIKKSTCYGLANFLSGWSTWLQCTWDTNECIIIIILKLLRACMSQTPGLCTLWGKQLQPW